MTEFDDEVGSPIEEFKAFAGDSGMNRSQSEYCNVGSKTSLTNHPAKKYVFDFMRVLIMENLCMTPASKQTPIVDLLLEVRRKIPAELSPFLFTDFGFHNADAQCSCYFWREGRGVI